MYMYVINNNMSEYLNYIRIYSEEERKSKV